MAGIHNMLVGASGGAFSLILSTSQTNLNVRTAALAAGWNGLLPLSVVINSGVTVSSNSTAIPALTVDGEYPLGVTLINRGSIFGMGGAGGNGAQTNDYINSSPLNVLATVGAPGGLALSVASTLTLDNSAGVIGGGGGGGGGGGTYYFPGSKDDPDDELWSGSGGGGGITGTTNSSGGIGRPVGAASADFKQPGTNGTNGTISSAGTGGLGGVDGGNGGSRGAAGAAGSSFYNLLPSAAGGAGGGAISGNSFITYIGSTGTRLGSIT